MAGGGGGGIRTPGTLARTTVFKTAAFNRSATPPIARSIPPGQLCRIGERSGHTWFVLTYLLGYDNVKNYDGSWTEWGSLVRAPIEK